MLAAMGQSSTMRAQESVLPDVEKGIVEEPDSRHSGSTPQRPPHQGSDSQQGLLQEFDKEVYTPVETHLALYDLRERELERRYLTARQARADRQGSRLQVQGKDRQLGDLPADCPDEDYDEFCYEEIENLVLIERSLIHSKALEEWERKANLFTSRVDRKSKKVGNLKNEVYQLIGFFSVFQGVVLTAVAQSNLLHCNNLWSPIGLSLLASLVTIAGVAQKLSHIWSFQKTISSEQTALKEAVSRGQLLRRAGKAFAFRQLGKVADKPRKEHSRWYTAPYTLVVLIFLFLFTLGFSLSHWRILCHPGHCPSG